MPSDEAGPEQEMQAIWDLGTPEEAADQIICNIAIKITNEPITGVKKGIHAVWIGILAVCAAPVALPFLLLAVGLLILLFAIAVMLFAVLVACCILVIIMGPVSICAGFTVFTDSIPASLICFGQGFMEIGIGLLLIFGLYHLGRRLLNWLVRFFGNLAKKGGK